MHCVCFSNVFHQRVFIERINDSQNSNLISLKGNSYSKEEKKMLSALSLSKVNNYIFGQAKKTWDLHEVELYLKLPLILNPDVSSNNTGHYLPPGTESEIGFF